MHHLRVESGRDGGRLAAVSEVVLKATLNHVVVVEPAVGPHHRGLLLAKHQEKKGGNKNSRLFFSPLNLIDLLEYLVGAHNQRTLVTAVFDLDDSVGPNPSPILSLKPDQQDARALILGLGDCMERDRQKKNHIRDDD